jgi:murein DD-endopeptidase MepM/ murein hydrolase activator NlpD
MDRRLKQALVLAFGIAAPFLSACTPETPVTALSWDVNEHYGRHAATQEIARTYVYDGGNYAVPAPKPRPDYTALQQARPAQQPGFLDRFVGGPAPSSVAFAWPGSGKVIAGFGATSNGERNDGINIAMKLGAPIRAAASGTVSYSGDELKDYGNLLLIKHDGGYVTAYAHADKLLVQRGDTVTRGQVIAYAGRTGDVSTPQLHFEIRKGTTPVDPDSLLSQRNS